MKEVLKTINPMTQVLLIQVKKYSSSFSAHVLHSQRNSDTRTVVSSSPPSPDRHRSGRGGGQAGAPSQSPPVVLPAVRDTPQAAEEVGEP